MCHQITSLEHWGTSHSYWLVFVCNIVLATAASASFVAFVADGGLEAGLSSAALTAAVNAGAPACVEAYAILMLFASLGKFNSEFFDPRASAATVHVMGAIENLTTNTPAASALRRLVDAAGPRAMDGFFVLAAVGGAAVEVAACALIYLGYPRLWSWSVFLMHAFFSLTAFDFSVAVAGVMPLFGGGRHGAVAAWLGWTTSRGARWILAIMLAHLVVHSGASPTATGTTSAAPSAKLHQLRRACQACFALCCPPMYVTAIPPGSLWLGLGTEARHAGHLAALSALGIWGYGAVILASCVACGLLILIGVAPYAGWRTAGSVTALYSNIVVERRGQCNHYAAPLLRCIGMPWCSLVHDLVTVIESDAPSIAARLKLAPAAPSRVFAGLAAITGAYRGTCYWHPSPPTWHLLLERANPDMKGQPVLPYELPYFELRCLISKLVAAEPERDFYVEYLQGGQRRRFSRKQGRTNPRCDQGLALRPPMFQRTVHCFRPLPVGVRGPTYG